MAAAICLATLLDLASLRNASRSHTAAVSLATLDGIASRLNYKSALQQISLEHSVSSPQQLKFQHPMRNTKSPGDRETSPQAANSNPV